MKLILTNKLYLISWGVYMSFFFLPISIITMEDTWTISHTKDSVRVRYQKHNFKGKKGKTYNPVLLIRYYVSVNTESKVPTQLY